LGISTTVTEDKVVHVYNWNDYIIIKILDDPVITSFSPDPRSTTLQMHAFSRVELGVAPKINALSTLLIITVSLALLLLSILYKSKVSKFPRLAVERLK
jgi:hypothetical protein